MADTMSAGARDDALPATDIYDLSTAWEAEAAEQNAAESPYRRISTLEITVVLAVAAIMWTAIFAALLS